MAKQPVKQTLAEALREKNFVKVGTPEHERLVEAGYGMTREKAETIIRERKENPASWPYDLFEKAQAFLAQLKAQPVPIDPEPGWHRERVE